MMSVHIHVHDAGTSEGARKAAETRKQHGGGGVMSVQQKYSHKNLVANGHVHKGKHALGEHYHHPISGIHTYVEPSGKAKAGKISYHGVTSKIAGYLGTEEAGKSHRR